MGATNAPVVPWWFTPRRAQFRCGTNPGTSRMSPVAGSISMPQLLCALMSVPRTRGSKPCAYSSSTVPAGNSVTVSSQEPSAHSQRTCSLLPSMVLSAPMISAGNCTPMREFSGFAIPLVNGDLVVFAGGITIPDGYRVEQVSPNELRFDRIAEEG